MNINEKLCAIQSKLKAPKGQFNKFGNYSYRSCEDILEGLKPLLNEHKATVILSDSIKHIGDRYYLEATATFIDIESNERIEVSALAREDENKKGMDLAQVTGSVSSYARKYALNGLFAIDDTKDSDSTNTHGKDDKPKELPVENKLTNNNTNSARSLSEKQLNRLYAIAYDKGIRAEVVKAQVLKKYNKDASLLTKEEYDHVCEGYEKLVKNQ